MKTYNVAAIPGDGIGTEVIAAGIQALARREGSFALRFEHFDRVIVRENSEGEYSGQGGRTHKGLPEEVATEVAVFTRNGVERIRRFAIEHVTRSRVFTPDLGARATRASVTEALCQAIEASPGRA